MTYAELVENIQKYLQNTGADLNARIPTIVRQAEDRIFDEVEIPALRKNVSGTFTVATKYLTLPNDFLSPFSLYAAHPSNDTGGFLLNKDVSFIREAYPDGHAAGLPRHYALFDKSTVIVGPTPDVSYEAELHYFYKPPSIVDAGTSWLGDNAETALLYGSLVEAYTFLKGEKDLMDLYGSRYAEAMARLKNLGEAKAKTDQYRTTQPRRSPT